MTAARTARLPEIAGAMLESVAQHRLLSTAQIHAIHTPIATRRWTQRLLSDLAAHGLVDAVRGPRAVSVWFVTEAGADTVEKLTTRAEPRRKLLSATPAAGPLQAHTLAVNDVGIAYLTAARARDDEYGPLSWRHEIAHPIGRPAGRRGPELLIADALITYLITDREHVAQHQRLVELDRGTMPVEALITKLRGYQRMRDYTPAAPSGAAHAPAWRAWYPTGLPAVQLIFTGRPRAQLERRIQLLLALHSADPDLADDRRLHVQLALLEDLTRHGPFAPIWLHAHDPARRVDWLGQPGSGRR